MHLKYFSNQILSFSLHFFEKQGIGLFSSHTMTLLYRLYRLSNYNFWLNVQAQPQTALSTVTETH